MLLAAKENLKHYIKMKFTNKISKFHHTILALIWIKKIENFLYNFLSETKESICNILNCGIDEKNVQD